MSNVSAPPWNPTDVESVEVIADLATRYTNGARAFVVFRYGTVVFSDSSSARPEGDYIETLLNCTRIAPDFSVRAMQDGNYLVQFQGPVAGIVTLDHYENKRSSIRLGIEAGGLVEGETVIAGAEGIPEEQYYVGLYARAKLYRDAREPVVEIHRP